MGERYWGVGWYGIREDRRREGKGRDRGGERRKGKAGKEGFI